MYEQKENINKETENIKDEPNEHSRAEEYNNYIKKLTTSVWNQTWSRRRKISKLKDRSFEMIQVEEQKFKRMRKIERSLNYFTRHNQVDKNTQESSRKREKEAELIQKNYLSLE